MATVLDQKAPAPKYASEVDEQIAQTTSRIRVHDLTFGGLLLAAMVLVYATGMILLDKYVVLPEWVRQLSLAGFLMAVGGVAYGTIVRPLQRRVNPLYAAVQVEKTVDNAKNSVVGYVEAQENGDVHPAVKAAMGARAAKSVGAADVNHAVDHRSLVYTGAVAVAFLLALVVLFFVFRPTQFSSLVGRTFAPFSSDPIASRTQLALVEPAGGDLTITAGQSVTVKVQVSGKVPSADKPDRVRVLLRHSPTASEYEEIPLDPGDTSRDWQVRVPDYFVRNGFWYKVAGGDAETPEHKVTVRSLPLFTEFDVTYEYPAYTRLKPETAKLPQVEALRGTKVTVTGKTNRTVKDGRAVLDPPGQALTGKVPADKPDSVQFQFVITTPGSYRISFTSGEGERSGESSFPIKVIEDQKPSVEIVKPEENEVTIPANGQLAVDGTAGDDFGVAKLTLRMKLIEPAPRALADKPYQGGKSFRREKDGSWPTSLEYKDSVDFTKLTDEAGVPVEVKEGMLIEYWLEAADNRTKPGATGPEPDPNLGVSGTKRVRVGPPVMAPEEKKTLDERKDRRKTEEQQHNQQQQQRLDKEPRDPNQKPNPPQDGMGMKEPNPEQTPNGTMPPMPMPGMPEMNMGNPMMPPPTPKQDGMGMPMKGMNDPMMPPGMPMSEPGMGGMNNPPPMAPPPSDPGTEQARKDAERVQQELNKQSGAGSAKSGPSSEEQRANPADPKPPMADGMPPQDPPKDGPKPNDPMNPMGGGNAAESKPQGNVEKPQDPSAAKPEPKSDANPMSPMGGGTQPAEPKAQPKSEPMGGMGQDKPQPKNSTEPMPMPMSDMNKTEDPSGGGGGKPATQQKPEPGMGMNTEPMPGQSQKNPSDGAAKSKPMPNNDRGIDQPKAGEPMGGGMPQDPNRKPDDGAGMGKPQTAPEPSGSKPAPMNDTPMPGGGGMSEPKPMPQDGMGDPKTGTPGASESKPDGTKPMGSQGANNTTPPGQDKGTPQAGNGAGQKPDPEKQKEFEDAVKDLASGDPGKKKAAQEKLDNMVGQKNRKDIEKKVDDFQNAVKDLNSKDEKTRGDAEKYLDKTVGEKNRKEIQDIANGLNSKDPKERQAAEQKLKDLQAKAGGEMPKDGQQKAGSGDGPKPKIDPKELQEAVKDLQSPDQAKRDAAKEKLDKTFGKGAGDAAEKLANDLNSKDPEKQKAAQKKIDDMRKQAEEMVKNNPPKKDGTPGGGGKKVDPKEVEQALDDLNSKDPMTREAAKQKLDDMLGKGTGDKAEQANKDANSGDPEKEGPARKQRDDLMKKAEQMARGEPKKEAGKPLSKEEIEQLAKKANDLNSKDEATRKAAEQDLDKQIGEQARKEFQDAMHDPKKAEELKKKLDEMAKNGGGELDPTGNLVPKGGGPQQSKVLEAMKADARNRAKSAQLQLEQFEKNKGNKDLLDQVGMTPEQYAKFLEDFRKYKEGLQKEADDLEKADAAPLAGTLPATNVSEARKIESRGGASGAAATSGATFAAPGYADALRKFQEGTTKVPVKKQP